MKKEKALILIPCNPGAFYGDYNLGRNWKMAKKYLGGLGGKIRLEFAAVDCIAAKLRNDAIVLEKEMSVVKGYGIHPHNSKLSREELALAVADGLKKLKKYKCVLVWLNVRRYHESLVAALNSKATQQMDLPPIYIFEKRCRFNCGIKEFAKFAEILLI